MNLLQTFLIGYVITTYLIATLFAAMVIWSAHDDEEFRQALSIRSRLNMVLAFLCAPITFPLALGMLIKAFLNTRRDYRDD